MKGAMSKPPRESAAARRRKRTLWLVLAVLGVAAHVSSGWHPGWASDAGEAHRARSAAEVLQRELSPAATQAAPSEPRGGASAAKGNAKALPIPGAPSSDTGAEPRKPQVEERAEQREPDVAALQREDRMAEAVHVMPGGRTVEGTLFMDSAISSRVFNCKERWTLCPAPKRFRRCKWCSESGCTPGALYANRADMVWHHTTNQRMRLERTARAYTRHEPVEPENPTTDVLLFSCHLMAKIPMHVPGTFTLRLPSGEGGEQVAEIAMSQRLTRSPMIVPPGSVATCGRATYGETNANLIVRMSEYQRMHGFSSLYLYNAGSTTMLDPMKLEDYLARLAGENSTALRYLDMRNHLDTLFGSSATYAFLTSHAGGQEWTKYDCALRARRDGHDWILHTDLDEYIFPGKTMIKRGLFVPMAERLKSNVREEHDGFSIASVMAECDEDMNPEMEWPLDPGESRQRWEAYMRRTAKHYLKVVIKDPLNHFSINHGHKRQSKGNACSDYRWCPGGAGTRKLFLRSTFPPIGLRVHHTNGGGTVWPRDARRFHLQHYKCVNGVQPPERLMSYPEPLEVVEAAASAAAAADTDH